MQQALVPTTSPARGLYRTAGIMAILIVAAGMVDAVTSNMGAGAQANSAVQITEWFRMFQVDPFAAFSCLGIINILTLTLGLPVYLAFQRIHRQADPVLASLAAVMFFVGAAVYLSSNTVFPLYALSRQYAAATLAQRPILEAAGNALLAQGADLGTGTYLGLLFTQLAGILIACVMLRGRIFSRWIGLTGLVGFSLMTIFFTLAAFAPARFELAMLFAMPGGLTLMAYQILLARRFFQLAKQERH